MAPLTWREVSAPNFSGVSESQRIAGQFLNSGFQSAIDAISGFGQDQRDRLKAEDDHRRALLGDQTVNLANDQTAFNNQRIQGYEAARPAAVQRIADIRTLTAKGDPESLAQAQQLTQDSAQIFAAAGYDPANMAGIIAGNMDSNLAGLSVDKVHQEWADANVSRDKQLAAEELWNQAFQSAGNLEGAKRMLASNSGANVDVVNMALQLAEDQGGAFGAPVDPTSFILEQSVQEMRGRAPGVQANANPLFDLITRTEASGYSTLYGNAERDGPLAGTDVSRMTIGQLKDFSSADGIYGRHQKARLGYLATPMGQFQIVGDTLRQAAQEMGLSDDTVFTPDVQNAMFLHLVNKRLSGPRTIEGKMAGLRQEWEGFKNVPDAKLKAAIEAYESGDASGLIGSAITQVAETNRTNDLDTVQQALDVASNATAKDLTSSQNQAFLNAGTVLINRGQSLLDTITADNSVGDMYLVEQIVNRPNGGKSDAEIVQSMIDEMGGVQDNGLLANGLDPNAMHGKMAQIQQQYGLPADVAAAFMLQAIQRNSWGTRWFHGQLGVDDKQFDNLVKQYYDFSAGNEAQVLKGTVKKLQAIRTKQSQAAQIQQQQQAIQQAQQEYFNALERKRRGFNVDVEGPKLRYEAILAQSAQTQEQIDLNPLTRSNTNSRLQ